MQNSSESPMDVRANKGIKSVRFTYSYQEYVFKQQTQSKAVGMVEASVSV